MPVLPFILLGGTVAVLASFILSGLALFAIGGAITLVTSRPVLPSGVSQPLFGLVAAGITFAIGTLVNTAVG